MKYAPINMSSHVSTEVEVAIGHLPSVSGFQLSLDIGSGLHHQGAIKSKLSARLGQDPESFKLYLTVPCSSSDAASKLSTHLKSTYEHSLSNQESPLGSVLSKLKPDPDEPSLASFDFSTFGHNVVIVVSASQHEDQARAYYEMASEMAGTIFNSGNLIHLEVDTGKNLGEILAPNCADLIFESVLVKFVFTADSAALAHATGMAKEMGPQGRKAQRGLALLSLYNGAALKLNLKSGNDAHPLAKHYMNALTSQIPKLSEILPPDALALINGIVEHSGHELFINVLTDNVGVEVHLSAKGASQILDRN